jgi:hypothetical protein
VAVSFNMGITRAWRVRVKGFGTPTPGVKFSFQSGYKYIRWLHTYVENVYFTDIGDVTFHVPPRSTFSIAVHFLSEHGSSLPCSMGITEITIEEEEPLPVNQYSNAWHYYG